MSIARIDVFSHNFKVTEYNRDTYLKVLEFCRPLIQTGLERTRGGRFKPTMLKIYAASTAERDEIRLHINLLRGFFDFMKNMYGYSEAKFEIVRHDIKEPVKLNAKVKSHLKPRDYQEPILEFILEENKHSRVVGIQTGKGKAQTLSSKVKVPGGWKRMGDVKVGDTVTAWDGKPCKVLGIYPQGEVDIFEVTFADGRKTRVTGDHLWKFFYVNTTPHKRWRVDNTKEMMRLLKMPNPRVYVPLCESEEVPPIDLPIDPYLMGVIMGDGCITNHAVAITKADQELFDLIEKTLPEGDSLVKIKDDRCLGYRLAGENKNNKTLAALHELGLMGKRSWEKELPEIYLKGSTEQRWSLLQGLMDTDGFVNAKSVGGSVSFCSTSLLLAGQVQYLVRSLGGIASISERSPKYPYKGELRDGRKAFVVNIRMKKPSMLFRLTRKKERTNDEGQYAKDLKLRVLSIVPVEREEAQCISIDHPDHLYITDDFIVTHNTFTALKAVELIGYRTLIVVPAMYADKWYADVLGTFDTSDKNVLYLKGAKSLSAAFKLAAADELPQEFLITTSTTLQIYLRNYEMEKHISLERDPHPEKLYEALGVGVRIIDELHKNIHLNIKMDLYSNVYKSIGLSATLKASNPFINKMTDMAYPMRDRYQGLPYHRYIDVYALEYRFANAEKVRHKGSKGEYSHVVFEQWLMRNPKLLDAYTDMLLDYVEDEFVSTRKPEYTAILFAATIDYCTHLTQCAKQRWPDLNIARYIGEDDYEALMKADFAISTVLSAGTAVDKYGLTDVFLSTSIDSIQSNEQAMGRLRELLQWPGVTPRFHYFFAGNVEKQVIYHERKKLLFEHKAKNQFHKIMPNVI